MGSYRFGMGRYAHRFCGVCGSSVLVEPHVDDEEAVVVNVGGGFFFFFFFFFF